MWLLNIYNWWQIFFGIFYMIYFEFKLLTLNIFIQIVLLIVFYMEFLFRYFSSLIYYLKFILY
jgi:hypothetical protein